MVGRELLTILCPDGEGHQGHDQGEQLGDEWRRRRQHSGCGTNCELRKLTMGRNIYTMGCDVVDARDKGYITTMRTKQGRWTAWNMIFTMIRIAPWLMRFNWRCRNGRTGWWKRHWNGFDVHMCLDRRTYDYRRRNGRHWIADERARMDQTVLRQDSGVRWVVQAGERMAGLEHDAALLIIARGLINRIIRHL